MLRKFCDDFARQCLINGRAAVVIRRRTVGRFGFGKHESIKRQVPVAIPDEPKINWSSHNIQPCMMRNNATISTVAKFEKSRLPGLHLQQFSQVEGSNGRQKCPA